MIKLKVGNNVNFPLIVETHKFQDKLLFSIREWYLDKKTGELKPTAKGISLKPEKAKALLNILLLHKDELNEVLEERNNETYYKQDVRVASKSTETLSALNNENSIDFIPLPPYELFKISYIGSQLKIQINSSSHLLRGLNVEKHIRWKNWEDLYLKSPEVYRIITMIVFLDSLDRYFPSDEEFKIADISIDLQTHLSSFLRKIKNDK